MRPGTKIAKSGAALLTIAAYPLGRSVGGHIESLRRHLQGTTLFDNHPRHLLSTVNRQSGILVVVHSVSLKNSLLVTTSFSRSDRMDNLLKLHTYSLFPVPYSLLPAPCLLPLSLNPQTARPDILPIPRRRKHLQRLRHAPEAPLPCRKRIVQNIGMKSLHRAS